METTLIVVEIPHQLRPKVWLTSKKKLIDIAERKLNRRGESLVTKWYRSEIEEYIDEGLTNVVDWFNSNPEAEMAYDVGDELLTEFLASLPENFIYDKAVSAIMDDNNNGDIITTQADIDYWLNKYHGHQETAIRIELRKFLEENDGIVLPN